MRTGLSEATWGHAGVRRLRQEQEMEEGFLPSLDLTLVSVSLLLFSVSHPSLFLRRFV